MLLCCCFVSLLLLCCCCCCCVVLSCCGCGFGLHRTALRWTALRRTAQNFALFLPFPATVSLFFVSLWVSSRGILVVFVWSAGAVKCARLGSRAVVRELQTCTFDGPGAPNKHHQNSTRRPPERHKKSETVAGKGRKRAKFWAPHPSGPHPSGPHPSGPHPSGQVWPKSAN